jgi:alanine dehydrogenase
MLPVGVEELVGRGHSVLIESGAGLGSGFTDQDYSEAGSGTVVDAAEILLGPTCS